MRICHFIYDHIHNPWVGGGGAVRAFEIYRRLVDRHRITIISGKYPGAKDYEEQGIQFRFLGTERNNYVLSTFGYALSAMRFLSNMKDRPDLIIEDFAPYNPLFSFRMGNMAVIQLHQKEGLIHLRKYLLLGIPFYLMEAWYHKFFSNGIVTTEVNRQKFGRKGNTAVISNGIDESLFATESFEGNYLLFMGRLHIHQKGLDLLQQACILGSNYERIVIAGAGRDEKKVIELFQKQVDSGAVEMVGFVKGKTKTEILRGCKLFLVPSRYEGQGIVVLEAAACGKPVIVSDIPELRYAVEAGFGLSFKTGDARDLAEKIRLLSRDEALRQEMGRKAREFAENFTWDRIALDYEAFLQSLAAKAGK